MLAGRVLVNVKVVDAVEVLVVLVVLDVSVGQCCESCGVALYIIDFIGVSWNLSPLINTRSCFYKNQ